MNDESIEEEAKRQKEAKEKEECASALIGIIFVIELITFGSGALDAKWAAAFKDSRECKHDTITSYDPGYNLGCFLFKKRW